LVSRIESSSLRRAGNPHAAASVVVGLAAVLAIPAGVVLSYYSQTVTLVESTSSAGLALILGLWAILLSRRGRATLARTIGRARGFQAARAGRLLGWLGLCMGITAGLSVGFYGLLTIFAKS
jgi:hypothetical protein